MLSISPGSLVNDFGLDRLFLIPPMQVTVLSPRNLKGLLSGLALIKEWDTIYDGASREGT